MEPSPTQSDNASVAAPRAPLVRLGLQGKLVLSFFGVLAVTLGVCGLIFGTQSSRHMATLSGDQAKQLSFALSLASKSAMQAGNQRELNRIAQDLLKTNNILFVAFLDAAGKPMAVSSRDRGLKWDSLEPLRLDTRELTLVRRRTSPEIGEYLEVMTPVFNVTSPADEQEGGTRLFGYVAVGVSEEREQAMLRGINSLIVLAAGAMLLLSVPLAYAMVHRIFLPIRRFVDATDRIAAGDLETRVAIDRADVIGTLARSFNEMVIRVRAQQLELEGANGRLEILNTGLEQVVSDRTAELEVSMKKLEELAATDPLTGLYNRRHFARVLEQLFAEAERYEKDVSCVMIDLDHYKQFNDTYGHQAGDELLILASKVIGGNLRKMDVAARYGGDEFVLLLPHANAADATQAAQRILQEFKSASTLLLAREQEVTMSIGIGSMSVNHPKRAEHLVLAADEALYLSKAAGRNRISCSTNVTVRPASAA